MIKPVLLYIIQTLPYISAIKGIKDFYLPLNHEDTDTMPVDVKEIGFVYCRVFQYTGSHFNGQKMKRSQEDFTVYMIKK
jgi:hypothetical protein